MNLSQGNATFQIFIWLLLLDLLNFRRLDRVRLEYCHRFLFASPLFDPLSEKKNHPAGSGEVAAFSDLSGKRYIPDRYSRLLAFFPYFLAIIA
jgi:hypothetical protein